jgi:hypothetical protein
MNLGVLHDVGCSLRQEITEAYNCDFDDLQVRYYNRYYEPLDLRFLRHVQRLGRCMFYQIYLEVF